MGHMGLSKFRPRKVPGPLIRRDAASVTRESCGGEIQIAETRVWSLCGLSADDIMAVRQLFTCSSMD
ncbi:unnamed protein product [Arabidopsis thaliana]|uniref:Uncharacterized protein n=3 Tax=Arabidopsis TaxID=3701 RepID=A0A8T2FJ05_ARASU|nr:hypothetical protein ISN45_At03g056290 [Arabidopsis thaliana x Arabidopsis arenosa]KAG7635416.1 hypothetical protein ISN44_As03g055100 [Arabidopsis suecica]OAP01588.1 hypothetical protein AXX17_AT3G57340 [Arabidopsis thaliana]CAA0388202.1 unnamed protein product [Arabidopsis thaliana]CAD5326603.1 unnamed protein product [Arabidopsis thaliana]